MNIKPPTSPIKATQELLAEAALDGFIIPQADEFQGEYISENNMRLRWLTGFTGSAGTAILYAGKVHLFVDGRYTLQAPEQVDPALVEVHGHRDPTPVEWLADHVGEQARIGYDPRLHSIDNIQTLKKALKKKQAEAVAVGFNPIDRLWSDRPAPPDAPVRHHDIAYTGRSSDDKISAIAEAIKEAGAEALVLNEMDAIAWAFNIRGGDTAYTPLTQAYALVHGDGHADLFADTDKFSAQTKATLGNRATLHPTEMFAEKLDEAGAAGLKVGLDKSSATDWTHHRLSEAGAEIVYLSNPTTLQRALKNDTEIEGARAAHRRDALAMIRFLNWFDEASTSTPLSELDIAAKILELRQQIDLFQGLSFATIAGAGPNGAIVHYTAKAESTRQLEQGSLLLLDSGGQYLDGTTDITRTLAIGDPSEEMRKHFTLVLKGHIAIASARFPVGTNGGQLDALARQHLWRDGLNYLHGTGHGVGSYLGVHEGPHRLAAGSTVPFEAGMFISNEPGLYLPGQYGIRIESLLVVINSAIEKFLEFTPLTLVPMDRKLIDVNLMNKQELAWLDDYHRQCYESAADHLDEDDRLWLAAVCAPLRA
ncbi:MAG: aminopeptidase P family protein [Rhodospirillaceae bacterium]|nr:aminopeptidase P family protein [Rhodospirillaceae bacterium]MBL6931117.1 aminopeptidase P family protein [Rhodospirillales bacterium]MBL6941253.1 aminopeptidase P family protein [Rhodospirillales bacterium]